jgi:Rrf2 family protein
MSVVTTRARYGLRLLIDLAERSSEGPVDLRSIALRQGIPETYLAKLAGPLLSAGLLRSVRGARGGYVLAQKPEDIDIYAVVEALEGQPSLVECSASPETCPRSATCGARGLWTGLEKAIRDYLSGKNLASVAAVSSQPEYFL